MTAKNSSLLVNRTFIGGVAVTLTLENTTQIPKSARLKLDPGAYDLELVLGNYPLHPLSCKHVVISAGQITRVTIRER